MIEWAYDAGALAEDRGLEHASAEYLISHARSSIGIDHGKHVRFLKQQKSNFAIR